MTPVNSALPESWIRRAEDVEEQAEKRASVLLRAEGAGLYRAMCAFCQSQFDIFGTLDEGQIAADAPLSTVPQTCLEHVERCEGIDQLRVAGLPYRLREIMVMQNRNTPTLFKLEAVWR